MKLTTIAAWAAFATWLAAAGAYAQTPRHAPFMIGVFAPDGGMLLPLASFNGTRWTAPWPVAGVSLPDSAREIPPSWWPGFSSVGWRAALTGGDRALKIVAPMRITTGCGQDGVALTTDYPQDAVASSADDGARIAATGRVTIRYVRTEGEYDDKTDVWSTGERLLLDALAKRQRTLGNLITTTVSKIPLEGGAAMWAIEAVGQGRHVRVWVSDAKSAPFELVDDEAAGVKQEGVGMLTPIGAIWGLDRLAVLAWRQGLGGGNYAVVSVDAKGVSTLISAGEAGC